MSVRATLSACFCTLLVLSAEPVVAQPVEWPTFEEVTPEQVAAVDDWSIRSVAWSNEHVTLNFEAYAWLGTIGGAVNGALAGSPNPDGSAWDGAWASGRRAALAELVARRAALPPFPAAPSALPATATTQVARMAQTLSSNADRSEYILSRALELAEPVLQLAEAGDLSRADRTSLARAYYDLNEGLLRAENENLNAALAALQEGHPNTALVRASIAMNLALVDYLRWQEAARFNEDASAEERAARIEAQADVMRDAAAELRVLAAAFIHLIQQEMDLGGAPPSTTNVLSAMQTFEQSALVEERIASALDGMARQMRAGSQAGAELQFQGAMAFAGQRLQLDAQRRALAAGQ